MNRRVCPSQNAAAAPACGRGRAALVKSWLDKNQMNRRFPKQPIDFYSVALLPWLRRARHTARAPSLGFRSRSSAGAVPWAGGPRGVFAMVRVATAAAQLLLLPRYWGYRGWGGSAASGVSAAVMAAPAMSLGAAGAW